MTVDLELLSARVWNPDIRPLVDEALRCYNAGAVRSCIVATWAAVSADIIAKLVGLADEGHAQADEFRASVEKAQQAGLSGDGVREMQSIERALIDRAMDFELIDSIEAREMRRIQEDRNLCAHPSLRAEGQAYEPHAEVARGHLAVALTALLVNPPTQGRPLVAEFCTYMSDPLFVESKRQIRARFFDRARVATRRSIIAVAAKSALLHVDPPDVTVPSADLARRMVFALRAFAEADHEAIRMGVSALRDRFSRADVTQHLGTLALMAHDAYYWEVVDAAVADRLQNFIADPDTPMNNVLAMVLGTVTSREARNRLPALVQRFEQLSPEERQYVVNVAGPDEYFVDSIITLMAEAWNFRVAEQAGYLLVAHARYLSVETLERALAVWFDNYECRKAARMPGYAVLLYEGTAHLGRSRQTPFTEFVARCKQARLDEQDKDDFYDYPALAALLA